MWPVIQIKALVESGEAATQTGPFGTQLKASDYVEHGTPVINVRNIGFGSLKPDKLEYLAPETVDRLASHLLRAGDIVFGRKGAVERHVLIRPPQNAWFQGSDCLRLRITSERIDSRFVSYFLLTDEHKQWMINQCSHGATMASLNQDIIGRITLPLPPVSTQRKIASILSAYDDLIQNNTRRIALLEEMAQSLYREWFVEYRFPGHDKARFVDSPLGKIPVGWKASDIGSVSVNFDRLRKPLSSMQRADMKGVYPYYGAAKIFDYINEYLFDGEYLLLAEDGSVITADRKPVVQLAYGKFWVNNHAHILQGRYPVSTQHLYLALTCMDVSGYVTGAAQPKITQANMNRMPFLLATELVEKEFTATVLPIFREREVLGRKTEILRHTRDLLLPKLMSGQLDVENLDIDTGETLAGVEA
jgi:type I restriction enzyme S subunit